MRGWPDDDRRDSRVARSVRVAEGVPMPSLGDVLVLAPFPLPGAIDLTGPCLRVEGTQGRTVFYVPFPDDEVPLGASYGWRLRRERRARRPRRYEEVLYRRAA